MTPSSSPSPYAAPSADETVILPVADDDAPRDDQPDDDQPDGGLAAELAKASPRRWTNKATVPLIAVLLAAGGFLGGVLTERNTGSSQPAAGAFPGRGTFAGGANGFPGGANRFPGGGTGNTGGANGGGTGAPATAPAAGGTTAGTVKLVQGGTIYVETADGTVITVRTGKGTSVRTSKVAKLSDLKAGAKVTVQGTAAGADTVTATSITRQ